MNSQIIATGTSVTATVLGAGPIGATVLAPDFGSVDDETVLVGYVLEDSQGRCFTVKSDAILRIGSGPAPWEYNTDGR